MKTCHVISNMTAKTLESLPPRRSLRNIQRQGLTESISTTTAIKTESKPSPPLTRSKPSTKSESTKAISISQIPDKKASILQARKLKSFAAYSQSSPFPSFPHPTPQECSLAHRILASIHGDRRRPEKIVAPNSVAGCGDSPSVLDALVRTILSQNTSNKNSSRAKLSMDKTYGRSDNWEAIFQGGTDKLQQTIKSGGLSVVKSKVIMNMLHQTKDRYGIYSLNHLLDASNDEAMRELLSFQGVGPKTASCVLLFCLRRDSFAVDTHVYRISGLLGWRPAEANREETQAHLEATVPDEDKYGLHVLMVTHGRLCGECKAGGKSAGKCALRKAFVKGKTENTIVKDQDVSMVKDEDL
ncbi:DNA glycosylase [Trichoderma sp. SZMC 28014]